MVKTPNSDIVMDVACLALAFPVRKGGAKKGYEIVQLEIEYTTRVHIRAHAHTHTHNHW